MGHDEPCRSIAGLVHNERNCRGINNAADGRNGCTESATLQAYDQAAQARLCFCNPAMEQFFMNNIVYIIGAVVIVFVALKVLGVV